MTPKFKKIMGTALQIPIFVSLAFSFVYLLFILPDFWRNVLVGSLMAIGVIIVLWNVIYSSRMDKKVDALLDILYKEINPERFIQESEALLKTIKSRAFRCTLQLNLAVGYEAVGRIDEAIRVTKEMDPTMMDPVSKAIFYVNAASFYAENGSVFEAEEAYKSGEPSFKKNAKQLPAAHMQLARGLLYFVNEAYEDAADAFEKARGKGFEDRHTLTKCQLFEAKVLVKLGKVKEAKALYRKILQKNTYPYILQSAKEDMENLEGLAE